MNKSNMDFIIGYLKFTELSTNGIDIVYDILPVGNIKEIIKYANPVYFYSSVMDNENMWFILSHHLGTTIVDKKAYIEITGGIIKCTLSLKISSSCIRAYIDSTKHEYSNMLIDEMCRIYVNKLNTYVPVIYYSSTFASRDMDYCKMDIVSNIHITVNDEKLSNISIFDVYDSIVSPFLDKLSNTIHSSIDISIGLDHMYEIKIIKNDEKYTGINIYILSHITKLNEIKLFEVSQCRIILEEDESFYKDGIIHNIELINELFSSLVSDTSYIGIIDRIINVTESYCEIKKMTIIIIDIETSIFIKNTSLIELSSNIFILYRNSHKSLFKKNKYILEVKKSDNNSMYEMISKIKSKFIFKKFKLSKIMTDRNNYKYFKLKF